MLSLDARPAFLFGRPRLMGSTIFSSLSHTRLAEQDELSVSPRRWAAWRSNSIVSASTSKKASFSLSKSETVTISRRCASSSCRWRACWLSTASCSRLRTSALMRTISSTIADVTELRLTFTPRPSAFSIPPSEHSSPSDEPGEAGWPTSPAVR
eukprot:CAMPEP_0202062966 /NCGR_PEP_ID=MMETSP0963-20130614/45237_2 /ASSEMBLY_ACC=CAM_ASM_000494 /TAXON_ID=4773 /ORGANISM="Schizochytrium aggregatum, Strain ATCC28209" /LENGTH=153 /DNA_ID=CAMNT_0048629319 /DNA_START=12 /DNA_END=473 /DNA_ORIENTATION=-